MSTLVVDPGTIVVAGGNPVFWGLSCANLGRGIYTAKVTLTAGDLPAVILNYTLNANRYFETEISEILKSAAKVKPQYTIAARGSKFFSCTHFISYTIQIQFYKDGVLQSGETKYYERKAIRAGNDVFSALGPLWDNKLLDDRFLSVLPNQREVTWSDWFTLPIWIDTAVDDGEIGLIFVFRKANGDLIDVALIIDSTYLPSQPFIHYINTLNNVVTDAEKTINKSEVATVQVIPAAPIDTHYTGGASITFKLITQDTLYPRRGFMFLNSIGGYDIVHFTGKKTARTKTTKERAQKVKTPSTQGLSEVEEYNFERTAPMTINSGFQKPTIFNAMQDLLASEDVYEIVDGVVLPIEIKEDTYPMDEDNQPIKSLEFDYTYKFQNYGLSRLLKVN